MRIALLINARLGSKRLPKKHLRDIGGKTALERLITRVKGDIPIIIATGNRQENEPLEAVAHATGVSIFFGDQHNIPARHLQAARQHQLDAIISLDADDLLVSPTAIKDVSDAIKSGAELVRTEGLPLGMNVLWAYKVEALISAIQRARPDQGSFDTGWGWIFHQPIRGIFYSLPEAKQIRATLDYPEDLHFFRKVFAACPKYIITSDRRLCDWLVSQRLNRINRKHHAKPSI